ncbi:SUMF1/EgtB/PvdO family nonheme iron enzyme [Fibrobacter sp.]|uniref:SUMF1/EgtB/PvdO family nonheme iron enzyme n=1 Tax=Fibrobacter sp. TaxID=35828 RepID=UPI00386AD54C
MELNDLQGRFNLVSMLLSAKPNPSEALGEFQQLLKKDYMDYTKVDDALSEEAGALLELQNICHDLEAFIHNKEVYSKNSIALAGGFSSGKSTFCNNLFSTKEIQLPVSIRPETAIPAYVISGDKAPNAFGLTSTGASVELGVDAYKQMNHEFLKSFNFNLKNLMPSVVIHAKMPKDFEHICFVDTPGYNSADVKNAYTNKDRETSLMFIRQAKMLFWFVGLDVTGTLTDSDVDFLQEVRSESPEMRIAVICNKAELKSQGDIDEVLDYVVEVLEDNDIPYEGVVAYSSRQKKSFGSRGKSLEDIFGEMNRLNTDKKKELQKRLKSLFRKHINADADRIQESSDKIKSLNKILLHFNSLMSDVESKFSRDASEARRNAIRSGGKAGKTEELNQESIEIITRDLSMLKANLEKDKEKYIANKDTATNLAAKMEAVVSKIFQGFDETADDLYVKVPGGTFTMGSDEGPKDSRPAHSVTLNSFKMKMTLVTQAEWKDVMGSVASVSMKGDSLPVYNMSFSQVTKYCNKLSEREKLTPCYDAKGNCDYNANGYRLPTEAEWEYAAQSFATLPLKSCAWYKDNSDDRIQPVAQKEENALGLFDMLGNVYEWVNDYWDDYSSAAQTNPHGPANGSERVIRGGGYKSNEKSCMVTARNMAEEDEVMMPIGFRVVKKG